MDKTPLPFANDPDSLMPSYVADDASVFVKEIQTLANVVIQEKGAREEAAHKQRLHREQLLRSLGNDAEGYSQNALDADLP